MSEKRTRIFLGTLFENEGKYGSYLTGLAGASGRVFIERGKIPGRWNAYLVENENREPRRQEVFEPEGRQIADPEEMPF